MKKILLLIVLAATLLQSIPATACTSAIFTGKSTPDGKPLMWKHRDTDEMNNLTAYIRGEKYGFLALTDAWYPIGTKKAWGGNNEAGFCIMNTASYNLKDDDVDEDLMVNNGKIIYRALEICATLADFEKMLDTLQRPMYVESNYGVIDAQGGAAYYEVNNSGWRKIDVNDPKMAPQGYLVYSNHSYTGRLDEGYGYIRYTNAENVIKTHITRAGEITPQWIFKALSRSFYHSLLGIDLTKENLEWFIDQDFIPRESTSCAMVFKGVKKGEDPMETVMWTVLGYPPVSVAVPLFIKAKEDQPQLMTRRGDRQDPIMAILGLEQKPENALMCDLALSLKANVFPIKRGNGYKYYNFSMMHNPAGTGYMQQLAPLEESIFEQGEALIKATEGKPYTPELFHNFYNTIQKQIEETYLRLQ